MKLAQLPLAGGRSVLALQDSYTHLGRIPGHGGNLRMFAVTPEDVALCEQAMQYWRDRGFDPSIWVPHTLLAPQKQSGVIATLWSRFVKQLTRKEMT